MQKSVILFSLLFILSLTLMAQENCLDKLVEQGVQMNKLKESCQRTKDSLLLIIEKFQIEQNEFILRISRLKEDSIKLVSCGPKLIQIEVLQKQVLQLSKDTIDLTNFNLINRHLREAINKLEIDSVEIQTQKTKNKTLSDENSGLQLNLNLCLSIINKRYDNSFDSLIHSSTIQSIENDITILRALNLESEQKQNINDLLLYKQAEVLLGKKYSKIEIEKAKQYLRPLIDKNPVNLLIGLFNDYESCVKNLKNTIADIQNKNELKAGTIDDLISDKKNSTLRIIEDYIYYNEVDLTKYTYLNQIVSELKTRKMKNIDADVKDLLDRL